MKELLELVEARRHAPNETVAVATVLRVAGSSYRRTGARMLINRHGRVAGSVSGGCLEQSVVEAAQKALHDGQSRLLTFDTTDPHDVIFGSGLGCRGKIWIGIEILQPRQSWPFAELAQKIRAERRPRAVLTWIREREDVVTFEHIPYLATPTEDDSPPLPVGWSELVGDALADGQHRFHGDDGPDSALVEWLAPPVALWIFGAGPDAPPLARLAQELGHDVTVVDRRPEFARRENFPAGTRVQVATPLEVPLLLVPDPRTVAVLMNHHYETDRSLLASLLPLGLPYVAALGPRQRTGRMLRELQEEGGEFDPKSVAALHAPAGLDLGADTPAEIALSILAEIQAVLAGRPAGKLKLRAGDIHVTPAERLPCAILA